MKKLSLESVLKFMGTGKKLRNRIIVFAVVFVIVVVAVIAVFHTNSKNNKVGVIDFEMNNIGELATQVAYVTQIDKFEDAQHLWGWKIPLTTASSIYSYDITVKAGIDFSKIAVNVDEKEKTITFTLPETTILSSEIDFDSLQVWDESTNIFTPLTIEAFNDNQKELESEAISKVEENGILEAARSNAEQLIKGMMISSYPEGEYEYMFN